MDFSRMEFRFIMDLRALQGFSQDVFRFLRICCLKKQKLLLNM